jgi:hypothetical protein
MSIPENYESLSLKKLDLEITKNGFIYRQMKRTKEKFMYSQHNKAGALVAYEVFLNRIENNHKAKERWCKLKNQEFDPSLFEEWYEAFPSDEEFGKRAWSYPNLERATMAFEAR